MRNFLPFILLFFMVTVHAQDLIHSRHTSYYTFIYKISNEEASALYEKGKSPLDPDYLHNLVDQIPSDSVYKGALPAGHYLFVYSKDNNLECVLESVNNLEMKIQNNYRDLLLSFQDQTGTEIKSLTPIIKRKKIPFNNTLNLYTINKSNDQGLIKVEYNGHLNYFSINRKYNNSFPKRAGRGVLSTFPVNHLASIVMYVPRSIMSLIKYRSMHAPGIYYRVKRLFEPTDFDGYLVLNKPKYKPGDTVKLKAFIISRKGKPVDKELSVQLNNRYAYHSRKELGTVKPYRPGAYQFEFILNDSLRLMLDKSYSITFNDKRYNNFPVESFDFEEYELKSNTFVARSLPQDDNKPAIILLKGTDSNDLPLFDIRADILVKPTKVKNLIKPSMCRTRCGIIS